MTAPEVDGRHTRPTRRPDQSPSPTPNNRCTGFAVLVRSKTNTAVNAERHVTRTAVPFASRGE